MDPTLPFLRLTPGATLPSYATPRAAAMDLCAAPGFHLVLEPGQRALVPTGFALAIPQGYVGLLFARSGLAAKQGICLANGVGVIDSDYRGELQVALLNLGDRAVALHAGDRIAQLSLLPVCRAIPTLVDSLDQTQRGAGGFGSTGLSASEQGGNAHGV